MRRGDLHPLLAFFACVCVSAVILAAPAPIRPSADFPFFYALIAFCGALQFVLTRARQMSRSLRAIQIVAAASLAPSLVFLGGFFVWVGVLGMPE
jgi:hypothetical protein